jgi:hypothetical protein
MRVLVTGMIAGINHGPFIQHVIDMGRKEDIEIRHYNLIDQLEATGEKKLDRLLGATDYLFQVLREREYRKIGYDLLKNDCQHAIIHVPATIEWNRINFKLKDHEEIAEYIKPDLIVTLIDAEWLIRDRLRTPGKNNDFMRRMKDQDHTIHEILSWMNEEVSLSEDWAEHLGVRHYVIPVSQHPLSLYKLVRDKDVPSFYVSYSMTHSDDEIRREINGTIKRLAGYGLVIDPQAIEIGGNFDNDQDREAIFSYTVHRDLHWFVGKTDATVAVHPYEERPPLSTGMMDELGHARDYLKRRYMIFPPKNLSPFTTDSYIEKGCIFRTSDEFFTALDKDGYKPFEYSPAVTEFEWTGPASLS